MKMNVLSVCATEFKDKTTGDKVAMFEVYCADAAGRVGKLYSRKEYKPGDVAEAVLSVRDGAFRVKLQ